jgi:hypothetical protein
VVNSDELAQVMASVELAADLVGTGVSVDAVWCLLADPDLDGVSGHGSRGCIPAVGTRPRSDAPRGHDSEPGRCLTHETEPRCSLKSAR